MDRLGRFTGCDIDGVEGAGNGRDGLHSRANAHHFPIRHAAFCTASTVGAAMQLAALIALKFIVRKGSPALGSEETFPNFYTLDRLNSHKGTDKARVQETVPVHVQTQAGWQVVCEHF